MDKEYLTIQRQIDHLVNDKGLDRTTIQDSFFEEKTYLDLVNPYSDIISIGRDPSNNHIYNNNESFDKFIECNRIDDSISSFLRQALGAFEKSFKSFLMNVYCQKMYDAGDLQAKDYSWIDTYKAGGSVFGLLDLNIDLQGGFPRTLNPDDKKMKKRIETLEEIKGESQKAKPSNLMAQHYLAKYGYIPMFVVIHTLSFGGLLALFEMLPLNDRITFFRYYYGDKTKRIDGIHADKILDDIRTLIIMRNIVNHYEPFFPFVFNYYNNRFKGLIDLIIVLKNHYKRCKTVSDVCFNDLAHISFGPNSYSSSKIDKIHKIVDAIK